jgi:hypothetical protein
LAACLTLAILATGADAQITGINATASSAAIKFNDTNSVVPPAGTTNVTQVISPWNGSLFNPGFPTDPNTLDFATGAISASGSGTSYSVLPSNIQLSQVNATSGFALLTYTFTVEFSIGSALPSQATLFPNFLISGTVGSAVGSFASLTGTIDYYDITNASYPFGLIETVNYNYLNVTPGAFTNAPVNGVPTNGFTPLIPVGSNLTLNGNFIFTVDPSSLSATSYMAPEPSSMMLAVLAGLPILLRRRR